MNEISDFPTSPTTLIAAILDGERERALALIARMEHINTPDTRALIGDNLTPLHYAVLAQDVTLVQALATAGAEIDARTLNGQTPIWLACNGGDYEVAHFLLKVGADPNIRDDSGYSPFGRIAGSTKPLVELLESYGGKI